MTPRSANEVAEMRDRLREAIGENAPPEALMVTAIDELRLAAEAAHARHFADGVHRQTLARGVQFNLAKAAAGTLEALARIEEHEDLGPLDPDERPSGGDIRHAIDATKAGRRHGD